MGAIPFVLVSVLVAAPARAESQPLRRFDVAASLGYAFPVGSSESGARLSDATFGDAPIDLTAMYRLSRRLAVGIAGRYGVVVPTLCTDSSDCISSLGHDVIIAARARFFFPRILGAEPYGDVGIGYEWFASKLADNGVTSAHSYNGPIVFSTELGAPFELGSRWTLGPAVGLALGTFVGSHLEAPGVSSDLGVGDRSIHAWLSLAVRTSVRF
jgi:hypothetical protein